MVSIVIPVYNSGNFLHTCLQSVHDQTFIDWECILVDDGSTDGSGMLCDEWVGRDPRFTVFHRTNHGAAASRNFGIDHANGEYIAFIDSDDYVDDCYLESLVNALERYGADLSVCGLVREKESVQEAQHCPSTDDCFSLDVSHADEFMDLCKKYLIFGPCTKIFRKEVVISSRSRFDERFSYGEDLMFNIAYLGYTERIATVASAPYHYRVHGPDSLSTRFRPDRFETDYIQWKALGAMLDEKGIDTDSSRHFLSMRLWGIVYDGLFLFPDLEDVSIGYLKSILGIPEISGLKAYQDCFDCSSWIKRGILHRNAALFFAYFRLELRK